MIEFFAFLAEIFSVDHLIIGSNMALVVVTYKAIPAADRHIARIVHIRNAHRVAKIENDEDNDRDWGCPC